ncbi:hypothetical protein LTR08_007060 [Meristemomyces frigidus]|nr:hypothetical protein LTR08_007060 [Meristemomyces frigidus]
MVFNCFKAGGSHSLSHELEAPRPLSAGRPRPTKTKSNKHSFMRRNGSAISETSTNSNESISKLPQCKGLGCPKIEAMMMAVPTEAKPSMCLRISHPRTYAHIIADMRTAKGCRDWKSFATFEANDVDLPMDEVNKRRAWNVRQTHSAATDDSEKSVDSSS